MPPPRTGNVEGKRGPEAVGTIDWRRNPKTGKPQWFVRVSLANGKRSPWIPLDPAILEHDREGAKAGAKVISDRARANGLVLGNAETVGAWFGRFHTHKEARGLSSVSDMRGRASKWIFPGLEFKAMRDITREDLEGVVRRLDRAVLAWQGADGERGEGKLSPSTAANVWGDLAHAFDEAVRCKDPSLRVLEANPVALVRGPETGADREGPILYSDEIIALLRGIPVKPNALGVPLYRRRVYAMAIYTKARRSELAALTAADVDVGHATIMVSKQLEKTKGEGQEAPGTKKTKTRRTRTIDVEAALLPLVKELVKAPEGRAGRLLRVPPVEDCAELLRKDLMTVGVTRDALHTEDATRTTIVFHSLRDTGLTHMAVRGDSPIVVQWAAGHTDFKMTQRYIDRGRVDARRIGAPLPPLPPEVLGKGSDDTGAPPGEGTGAGEATAPEGASENLSPNLSPDRSATSKFPFSLGNVVTPTGIEGAKDPPRKESKSSYLENDGLDASSESDRVRARSSELAPVRASESGTAELTDEQVEALYLDALRDERHEDADELREIRRRRRHARAGNVAEIEAGRARRSRS